MAPSAARFIDTAFARSGSFSLSYTHHRLKWLIRADLLALFNEFPSLSPRADHFTADDGATFYLLSATGTIASVPFTIWLPPTYPFAPPLAFLSATTAIIQDHPFVDSTTGAVLTPYLLSWKYPSSNLPELARNLQRILRLYSPLPPSSATAGRRPPNPFLISKQEAIDRLALALFYDVATFRRQTTADISELVARQSLLRDHSQQLEDAVSQLECERFLLQERTEAVNWRSEMLQDWLVENQAVRGREAEVEEMLECVDGESRVVLESSADDLAMEDVMDRLDRALQEGRVELAAYMKHVRCWARKQFFCRAKCGKIMLYRCSSMATLSIN
ncbi:hypothetical protein EJ110_NYTH54365 [Nymphaea thermarum]|nr:hypothetical protein EJ110_NYTH54365 [Nymphaea thermarum]